MESSEQIAELTKVAAALREENQLLLRRLYGNKTERQNMNEAQLAFADLLKDKAGSVSWTRLLMKLRR